MENEKLTYNYNKIITSTSKSTVAGMAQYRSRKTLFLLWSIGKIQRTNVDLIHHVIILRNKKKVDGNFGDFQKIFRFLSKGRPIA